MRFLKRAMRAAAESLLNSQSQRLQDLPGSGAATQKLLAQNYQRLRREGGPLPGWKEAGFQAYSQTDEDGLLLYLFALIGTTNKRAVEAAVENGIECNTANLVINHGWQALMFDGSTAKIQAGQRFYSTCRSTWVWPPTLVQAWIDAEGINTLLAEHGYVGEVDLLSLDIDGMDYWVWKAIDCITPRVVVVEYQPAWGPERSVAVPYKRDFNRFDIDSRYWGASLAAFGKLGREKGYRLVGSNRYDFNAFFVRDGIGEDVFPRVDPDQCLQHPYARRAHEEWLPAIRNYPWAEV